MPVIGLSGYARSGKDTVADILISELGFERITFAAKLREAVRVLDPIIDIKPRHCDACEDAELLRLSDAMKDHTYGQLKDEFPEYRALLQRMGTEVGRDLFGEDFWVDIALKDYTDEKRYVITDCRFPNEYGSVIARGGEMWRVHRRGYGPVNNHPSETSLDHMKFDFDLINNGTLEELTTSVLDKANDYLESFVI